MSVLALVSIAPLDKGASVGDYVARALDVIDASGVAYQLGPMGTTLEGTWDEVMGVIKACHDALIDDCERVSVLVKIDSRPGKDGRLTSKAESVEQRVGRPLRR